MHTENFTHSGRTFRFTRCTARVFTFVWCIPRSSPSLASFRKRMGLRQPQHKFAYLSVALRWEVTLGWPRRKTERFYGNAEGVQRKNQKFAVNRSAERQRWRRQFKLSELNLTELNSTHGRAVQKRGTETFTRFCWEIEIYSSYGRKTDKHHFHLPLALASSCIVFLYSAHL